MSRPKKSNEPFTALQQLKNLMDGLTGANSFASEVSLDEEDRKTTEAVRRFVLRNLSRSKAKDLSSWSFRPAAVVKMSKRRASVPAQPEAETAPHTPERPKKKKSASVQPQRKVK